MMRMHGARADKHKTSQTQEDDTRKKKGRHCAGLWSLQKNDVQE